MELMWLGIAVGVAGAALGSYCSVKNTKNENARSYMVKMNGVFWAASITLVVILNIVIRVLPSPVNWIVFGIIMAGWAAVLPFMIFQMNKNLKRLQGF